MFTNAAVWNKIYELDFLISHNIKFADTVYAEDAAFMYKTLCSASSIYLFDELLYSYSSPDTNPNSNDKKSCSTWQDLFKSMDEVWDYIKESDIQDKVQIKESFICSMIGHIRYAQTKMRTPNERSDVTIFGFEWLSRKQHELEKEIKTLNAVKKIRKIF